MCGKYVGIFYLGFSFRDLNGYIGVLFLMLFDGKNHIVVHFYNVRVGHLCEIGADFKNGSARSFRRINVVNGCRTSIPCDFNFK